MIDHRNPDIPLETVLEIKDVVNEVEIETVMTIVPEVEEVQDHQGQTEVGWLEIHQIEVLVDGGRYRGRLLPDPRKIVGLKGHLATDTSHLLEMIVITAPHVVNAIAIWNEAVRTTVEAMGLLAMHRQILYLQKC